MSDSFEVVEEGSDLPTAINLDLEDAEAVDFNLAVLNLSSRTRRNPAGTVAEVDTAIIELINTSKAPSSFKAAKKAANALGLSPREVSKIVQELGPLYKERDVLIFPEFAQAVSDTLVDGLSKNQKFFASYDLVKKAIECQASAFRNSVSKGAQATYEGLSKKEKSFLQDLLLLLEVFVGLDEDASLFASDSTFFDSLGCLTKDQIRALSVATENITFMNVVGSHYAPYVMLTLQGLFTLDSKLTIEALTSRSQEEAQSSFQNLYVFLEEGIEWDKALHVSRYTFESIAKRMQGTGVDSLVMNVCLPIFTGAEIDSQVLLRMLKKGKAIPSDQKAVAESPIVNAFLFAKAINICNPDLEERNKQLRNAYKLKPKKAFQALSKTIKTPPTIDSNFIWEEYVTVQDGQDMHYLEWGFRLYAAAFKAGISNFDDDPAFEKDMELCLHLGTDKGRKDLNLLIELCEKFQEIEGPASPATLKSLFGLVPDGSLTRDRFSRTHLVSLFSTHPRLNPAWPSNFFKYMRDNKYKLGYRELLRNFDKLSVQSLSLNLLYGALAIPNPYDLSQFSYEIVSDGETTTALSVPYNPLELISGYRTLGSCCMKPHHVGAYASMSSFYGDISNFKRPSDPPSEADRTAYLFTYTEEKGQTCMGTLFLPLFRCEYNEGQKKALKHILSRRLPVELVLGTTAMDLYTQHVIEGFPSIARSYDGWEYNDNVSDAKISEDEGATRIVRGILGSSAGPQMGLVGSAGGATQTQAQNDRSMSRDSDFTTDSVALPYLDYGKPNPTPILQGTFAPPNADAVFEEATFILENSKDLKFSVKYKNWEGKSFDVNKGEALPADYIRYMWSFPKMSGFVPLEGTAVFKVKASDYSKEKVKNFIMDLVIPEWFLGCDANPLERNGEELRTADIIEMRRPMGGVKVVAGKKTEYIVDPRG